MAQLLAALADRHRVALLYLRGADEPSVDDGLRGRCELVEEVRRDSDSTFTQRLLRRAYIVRSRLDGTPRWVAEWAVRSYAIRVRTLVQVWRPDIVQIEYHVMGQYVPALSSCTAPRVLIQHDPGAAAARDRWEVQRGLPKLLSLLEVRAWDRYERAIMRKVQAIVVFTDRDKLALAPLAGQVPIVRIPIGTVVPEQPLDPQGSQPPSICFVGSFIHPPNTDAAARLIGAIFPCVKAQFPELALYVLGDGPPAWVREMAGENVFVTGRVPDTGPYLDRATLVAVPLRLGGGMRVKVLEALAAGKAVIASSLALEGLDLTDGEQVVLAETDQQFCDAIAGLLRDPGRRVALARRARAWACANLGWEKSVAAYETLYTSLITG
jgi:glycosyltransferase involved in cell wall biosynthesis